ncbi:MAG TPA: PQQ-binding-like beta-propeller repeat protein [Actinocatenispora sp.]
MRARMAGVVLGLAGLLAGVAGCGSDLVIDEATAHKSSQPAPVTDPTRTAWTLHARLNSGTTPIAAGPGVVYGTFSDAKGLPDRVVAIDGKTGHERWHYARQGRHSSLVRLTASPDGKRVAAWFERDSQQLLVMFDAMTGVVVWHRALDAPTNGYQSVDRFWATDHTLVTYSPRTTDGMFRLDGYDINTGRHLWHWYPGGDTKQYQMVGTDEDVTSDAMLLPVLRADAESSTIELVSLADRTGKPTWRHDFVTDAQPLTPSTQAMARVDAYPQDPERLWFSAGVVGGPQFAGVVTAADGQPTYKLPVPTWGLPNTPITVGLTPQIDVYGAYLADRKVVPASVRTPATGKAVAWPAFTGTNAALLGAGETVLEAHLANGRYTAVIWSLPGRKRLGSVNITGHVTAVLSAPGAVVLYDSLDGTFTGLT